MYLGPEITKPYTMNSRLLTNCLFLVLISGILAFPGCKEDDNNPPGDTYQLVSSQVIGPGGGSIISDDVMIEFPSGALPGTETIELYSSSTENPFGVE